MTVAPQIDPGDLAFTQAERVSAVADTIHVGGQNVAEVAGPIVLKTEVAGPIVPETEVAVPG